MGDLILIGSVHSAGTLRIKEFLMRNGHPYSYIDLEQDPDVQNLLDSFQIVASDVPVLICRGQVVLRNPGNRQIADCLGFNESIDQTQVRDLIVVGAGPSGLAAQYTVHQKCWMLWYWKRVLLAVKLVQAQKLKIIWDFLPGSQVRT